MRGIDAIARAVRRIFAQQRTQARHTSKTRFGDWNSRLADAIQEAVATLYLSAAKGAKARAEHADRFASLARSRAQESARQINATTNDMLEQGRDPWTPERVAGIAANEALYARSAGVVEVTAAGKGRLRWKTHNRPGHTCEFCIKMNGRTVAAGKVFGIHNGEAIYQPPAHFWCGCEVEMVGSGPPSRVKPHERPGMVDVELGPLIAGES